MPSIVYWSHQSTYVSRRMIVKLKPGFCMFWNASGCHFPIWYESQNISIINYTKTEVLYISHDPIYPAQTSFNACVLILQHQINSPKLPFLAYRPTHHEILTEEPAPSPICYQSISVHCHYLFHTLDFLYRGLAWGQVSDGCDREAGNNDSDWK